MKLVLLAAFLLASIVHLYASFKKNNKLRACSKVFLLSTLLGWYGFCASPVSLFAVLALFFSWLGDVLLIPKGMKIFACGGFAFFISHVCFCIAYTKHVDLSLLPLWLIAVVSAVYGVTVLLLFKQYRGYLPKLLFFPMLGYLLTNGAMNCFALFRLFLRPCVGSLLTFVGAVLFFISDACLFSVRFNRESPFKSHFIVMLSYLLGEFLIVWGLILFP